MSFLANCLVRSCQSVEKAVSGAQYFGPELKSHLHYLRVGSLGTFHIMKNRDSEVDLKIIFHRFIVERNSEDPLSKTAQQEQNVLTRCFRTPPV